MRFGTALTRRAIASLLADMDVEGDEIVMRMGSNGPLVTDESNNIVDLRLKRIGNARTLAAALSALPGVVEHGLFIDMAATAILGRRDGSTFVVDRPLHEALDVVEQMRSRSA